MSKITEWHSQNGWKRKSTDSWGDPQADTRCDAPCTSPRGKKVSPRKRHRVCVHHNATKTGVQNLKLFCHQNQTLVRENKQSEGPRVALCSPDPLHDACTQSRLGDAQVCLRRLTACLDRKFWTKNKKTAHAVKWRQVLQTSATDLQWQEDHLLKENVGNRNAWEWRVLSYVQVKTAQTKTTDV